MEEKIKISLPEEVGNLLRKDCVDFKVFKKNGESNMNAFLNSLLVNFYEEFSAAQEKLYDEIRQALSAVPAYYQETAFCNVLQTLTKRNTAAQEKKKSVLLSFKPTKSSGQATAYIEHILLQNESLSSFYRRLFSAYAQRTKNEREKIIYREQYELLQKAIRKGAQVCLTLKSGEFLKNACVYSVSPAKDELFNYILLYTDKKNMTVRLASVQAVSLRAGKSVIPEENKLLFARQVACAAQYPMYSTDREPIRVQLTEKGKKLFQKIYLYRPEPVSVEGDIYTFDCSANQLLYYFERFGDSAVVLSPKRLGIFMRNYYYFAYKTYRDRYRRD